jgi:hypothetical protein
MAGVAFWFKQQAGVQPGTNPTLYGERIEEVPTCANFCQRG